MENGSGANNNTIAAEATDDQKEQGVEAVFEVASEAEVDTPKEGGPLEAAEAPKGTASQKQEAGSDFQSGKAGDSIVEFSQGIYRAYSLEKCRYMNCLCVLFCS